VIVNAVLQFMTLYVGGVVVPHRLEGAHIFGLKQLAVEFVPLAKLARVMRVSSCSA
jgi:hypothetical protein